MAFFENKGKGLDFRNITCFNGMKRSIFEGSDEDDMSVEKKTVSRNMASSIVMFLLKAFHFFFSVALFFGCWLIFRYGSFSHIKFSTAFRYDIYVGVLYSALLYFFSRIYHTYLLGYVRIRNLVAAQLMSQCFSAIFIICTVFIAWYRFVSPTVFLCMFFIDAVFDCFWSWSVNSLFCKYIPKERAIVLYGNEAAMSIDPDITGKPVERYISIENEILCSEDNILDVLDDLKNYDVFFAINVSHECFKILSLYCKKEQKDGFFLPSVEELVFYNAYHIQSFHEPLLVLKGKQSKPDYLFVKRAFDIFVSLFGIIVFAPLMLITAIAIKVYDKGPAIYKQKRLTVNGRTFTIYKFRSMNVDAEKEVGAVLSSGENDSRITPIGKVIRAVRLDELPQLFNVLKGEMTIVGPRPERPEIAEKYYETIPEFKLRLQVKAGLTGYAQIYGKYNTSPEQKLKFDLIYINNMSILTDIKLLFATLGILFSKESTEGIDASPKNSMANDYVDKDE